MNSRTYAFLAVLLLLPFLSLMAGCDAEASRVRDTDSAYDAALNAQNGTVAVTFISKDSIKRLDRLVGLARTASKSKVQALLFSERYEVLKMRLLLSADELRKIDGRGYYIRVVNKGWVGSTSEHRRGRITFNKAKDRATISYRDPDTDITHRGYYVLEDGAWKEDQLEISADEDRDSRSAASSLGVSEDQAVLMALENSTDRDIPDSIWDPPR